MKQFDEIFTGKLKEALNNYNADHLADKGWNSFMARRKRKFAGVFFIPLWAKAASLLLIISAGTFLTYRILNRKDEVRPVIAASKLASADTSIIPEKDSSSDNLIADAMSTAAGAAVIIPEEPAQKGLSITQSKSVYKMGVVAMPRTDISADQINDYVSEEPPVVQADTIAEKPDAEKSPADVARQEIVADELLQHMIEEVPEEVVEAPEKVREPRSKLMAGVSGMMAVIDNTMAGAPGVAAGFYYEYSFSRRVAIRPGMAIAMHSSSLENKSGRSDMNYAAPLYDGTSGNIESYDAQLSLVALELPVNMVFNIVAKEKSTIFLSAGASTMICLSQKFTGTFVNSYKRQVTDALTGESTFLSNYSTVEVEKKEGAFSHADYFGLANLSAGYSMPFGKGSMLVEPYVQMPLRSITSLRVKIFYSGISAKIKFGK